MRYLIATCTLLFTSIAQGEVTITPEQQFKLDMMFEQYEMKFASNCKLAIADTVFCDCLADKVGVLTHGRFWLYTQAMSMGHDDAMDAKSYFKVTLGDELAAQAMSHLPV